jgi:hypothetical protein
MIGVTCNAACSIALRNAIFKAVPFALAKAIYEAAKKTAVGDSKTLLERRTKGMSAFASLGVKPDRIFAKLEVVGIDDIGLEHLETLIGLHTAIKDGDTTVDEVFPEAQATVKDAKPRTTKAEPAKESAPAAPKEATTGSRAATAPGASAATSPTSAPVQASATPSAPPSPASIEPPAEKVHVAEVIKEAAKPAEPNKVYSADDVFKLYKDAFFTTDHRFEAAKVLKAKFKLKTANDLLSYTPMQLQEFMHDLNLEIGHQLKLASDKK